MLLLDCYFKSQASTYIFYTCFMIREKALSITWTKPSEFVNVNHTRDPKQMTTDELAAEILRERAAAQGRGEEKPSQLH